MSGPVQRENKPEEMAEEGRGGETPPQVLCEKGHPGLKDWAPPERDIEGAARTIFLISAVPSWVTVTRRSSGTWSDRRQDGIGI